MTDPTTAEPVLDIANLAVTFDTPDGDVEAVKGVSFSIAPGECLGIVGESGSGKSQTFLAAFGLSSANARVSGAVKFKGRDVLGLPRKELDTIRGRHVAFVFQDPLTALTPHLTVETQMNEVLAHHFQVTGDAARQRAIEWLERVRIPEATRRLAQYPHELSGGMRQRVMIAMAMMAEPALLVADEPTTALDVIVQDRILKRIRELQRELNMAMIYISHDIAVIAEVSDRIGVMYAGRMAEMAESADIFERPMHPYTYALMGAFPSIKGKRRDLKTLPGEPPDLLDPPLGCRFHPRCPYATEVCREKQPDFMPVNGASRSDLTHGHYVACWHPMQGVTL